MENMEEQRKSSHVLGRKKGGLVTMPFIFGMLLNFSSWYRIPTWLECLIKSLIFIVLSIVRLKNLCIYILEVDLDCVFVTYVYWHEKYCYCWFYVCLCVANEICEKLAVVGFGANMISYLTTQLHMPITKAANTLTNFAGTASLTPLIGAFIADSFIGRFWTITVASIIYQIVPTLSLTLKLPIFAIS